jgi:hypothetical protein
VWLMVGYSHSYMENYSFTQKSSQAFEHYPYFEENVKMKPNTDSSHLHCAVILLF